MSKEKIPFSWKCPKCRTVNRWNWDKWDILGWLNSEGDMICEHCGNSSRMVLKFVKVKE